MRVPWRPALTVPLLLMTTLCCAGCTVARLHRSSALPVWHLRILNYSKSLNPVSCSRCRIAASFSLVTRFCCNVYFREVRSSRCTTVRKYLSRAPSSVRALLRAASIVASIVRTAPRCVLTNPSHITVQISLSISGMPLLYSSKLFAQAQELMP